MLVGTKDSPNSVQCIAMLRTWLCVHVVVLAVVIVFGRWGWLLLFQQLLAIERTGRVELKPRPYAIQIEKVVFVAGELNYQRVFVWPVPSQPSSETSSAYMVQLTFEEWIDANWAGVARLESLLRHPLQLVQEAVWHAFELCWRVVCILPQHLDHVGEQIIVAAALVLRRSSAHHLEGVRQQPEGRRHVFWLRHGIGVCMRLRIGRVYQLELREECREIWSAWRRLRLVVLVGNVVLDCMLSIGVLHEMAYRRALAFVARHVGG